MEQKRNNSIKRSAILSALQATKEHPSAEMIYESLKSEFPDLSLGTVYRNLAIFCSDGSAVTVCTVCGKERFDGRTDAHSHFICRECRRVMDIEVGDDASEAFGRISSKYGYIPESVSLVYTGVCDTCAG